MDLISKRTAQGLRPGWALRRSASRGRAGAEGPRGGRERAGPRGSGLPRARRAEPGPRCARLGPTPRPRGGLPQAASSAAGCGDRASGGGGDRRARERARGYTAAFWGDGAVSGNLVNRARRPRPPPAAPRRGGKGGAESAAAAAPLWAPLVVLGLCQARAPPGFPLRRGSARGPRASPSLAKCQPFPACAGQTSVPTSCSSFCSYPALPFGNLHFLVCKIVQQMLATVDSLKELGLTIGG